MNIAKIKRYTSFEDFNSNDMKGIIEKVCIGPQAEVLDAINAFNEMYDTSLGINKNFGFKPGVYREIKDLYTKHILRWDMKPRGFDSIFNRIHQYGWRLGTFKRKLLKLEDLLKTLRSNNIQWQDNTDDIKEELDRLKNHITKNIALAYKHYDTLTCNVVIAGYKPPVSTLRNSLINENLLDHTVEITAPNISDYLLMYVIKFEEGIIKYQHLKSNSRLYVHKIPIPGNIYVVIGIKLVSLLSNIWKRDYSNIKSNISSVVDKNFRIRAMFVSSVGDHPYIRTSIDKTLWDTCKEDMHLQGMACMGSLDKSIQASFYNANPYAGITHLYNWLHNYYVPQTYPINRIYKLYTHGSAEPLKKLKEVSVRESRATRCVRGCNYVKNIPDEAYNYVKNNILGNVESCEVSTDDSYIKYFNNYDFSTAPCHYCKFLSNSQCSHVENLHIVLLDDIDEQTEAILGVFAERQELMATNNIIDSQPPLEVMLKNSSHLYTFIEEFWIKDLEYHTYLFNKYRIFLTEHRRDNLCEGEEYDIIPYMIVLTVDKLELLLKNKVVKSEEISSIINARDIAGKDLPAETPPSLEELLNDPTQETRILTPEEATLQWASQIGGADNL